MYPYEINCGRKSAFIYKKELNVALNLEGERDKQLQMGTVSEFRKYLFLKKINKIGWGCLLLMRFYLPDLKIKIVWSSSKKFHCRCARLLACMQIKRSTRKQQKLMIK